MLCKHRQRKGYHEESQEICLSTPSSQGQAPQWISLLQFWCARTTHLNDIGLAHGDDPSELLHTCTCMYILKHHYNRLTQLLSHLLTGNVCVDRVILSKEPVVSQSLQKPAMEQRWCMHRT